MPEVGDFNPYSKFSGSILRTVSLNSTSSSFKERTTDSEEVSTCFDEPWDDKSSYANSDSNSTINEHKEDISNADKQSKNNSVKRKRRRRKKSTLPEVAYV